MARCYDLPSRLELQCLVFILKAADMGNSTWCQVSLNIGRKRSLIAVPLSKFFQALCQQKRLPGNYDRDSDAK